MDKLLHLLVIYALTLTTQLFYGNIFLSIGVGSLTAILKEVYDSVAKKQNSKETLKDLMFDGIGLALALLVIIITFK